MILVTGGLGFIGSIIVAELNSQGRNDILICDRFRSNEKWRNVRDLNYNDMILPEDLFHPDNLELFNEISEVYHMGACSSTTERDMDFLWANNVEFSKNIFVMCAEKAIPLVYASSAATYGFGAEGYSDDHSKVKNHKPLNAYGYSKQIFDEWVLESAPEDMFWVGVKFFNVFGPHEYHKGSMRSMAKQAHEQIKEKGQVSLFKSENPDYKDGEQQRDFIYVKDAARACVELMGIKDPNKSGLYNMGTGQANTWRDFVQAVFKALELPPNIKFMDLPEGLKKQYQYYTCAEMKKFQQTLPNFKFLSLEDSVADYVSNHLEKEWYLNTRK
jgi:ADP-L-glycero-D-manno-heptose 6-epimerase